MARIRETARLAGVPLVFARTPAELTAVLEDPTSLVLIDLTGGLDYEAIFDDARRRAATGAGARFHHARARSPDPALARAVRPRRDQGDSDGRASGPSPRALRVGGASVVTAEEFVRRLDEDSARLLGRLAPDATLKPELQGALNVVNLLKVALRNELEATELAGRWLVTTADVRVKLAFARQVGDEAKHYRLIVERLRSLGVDASTSTRSRRAMARSSRIWTRSRPRWSGGRRALHARGHRGRQEPPVHRVLRPRR